MAMLALFVSGCINDVIMMVVSLGEAESCHKQKAFLVVSQIPCFLVKQCPRAGDQDTDLVRPFRGWSRLN